MFDGRSEAHFTGSRSMLDHSVDGFDGFGSDSGLMGVDGSPTASEAQQGPLM